MMLPFPCDTDVVMHRFKLDETCWSNSPYIYFGLNFHYSRLQAIFVLHLSSRRVKPGNSNTSLGQLISFQNFLYEHSQMKYTVKAELTEDLRESIEEYIFMLRQEHELKKSNSFTVLRNFQKPMGNISIHKRVKKVFPWQLILLKLFLQW